jgi:hypothetical protein
MPAMAAKGYAAPLSVLLAIRHRLLSRVPRPKAGLPDGRSLLAAGSPLTPPSHRVPVTHLA